MSQDICLKESQSLEDAQSLEESQITEEEESNEDKKRRNKCGRRSPKQDADIESAISKGITYMCEQCHQESKHPFNLCRPTEKS